MPVYQPEYQTFYDSADGQTTCLIRARPENIVIKIIGDTLYPNYNGINGTFFDTPNPVPDKSCWGLAVNNGKPIGPNAHTTDWGGTKRGVVAFDGEKMICRRINDYREIPGMIWGMSGVMLMPEYDRYVEKYLDDIYRKTHHTVIGFDRENNIYLFVRTNSTMTRLIQSCAFFNLIGAISLDGGGSSQLNFNGQGFRSSRKINNGIIIKG